MSKFSKKYRIGEITVLEFLGTLKYMAAKCRDLTALVTAFSTNNELAQLAHAIQRRGYEHGFGLQDVCTILYAKRDTERKAEEQEAPE